MAWRIYANDQCSLRVCTELLILRSFEQRVFLWAADHLVERCPGGDHWVDAILFFYGEVDEEGGSSSACFCNGWGYILALGDVGAGDAVGVGEFDEVRRKDGRAGVVLVVEGLLPLANHAKEAVVDDGDVDVKVLLLNRGELRAGHLEAAVAGDDPDVLLRA